VKSTKSSNLAITTDFVTHPPSLPHRNLGRAGFPYDDTLFTPDADAYQAISCKNPKKLFTCWNTLESLPTTGPNCDGDNRANHDDVREMKTNQMKLRPMRKGFKILLSALLFPFL
jgi:hypothetical protein